MNTNINFQLFRAIVIGSVMFFAFAESVFAAPALPPPTATQIQGESARLTGFVSNHYQNTTVWFEVWGAGAGSMSTPTAYATQGIWHEGRFEWTVRDLVPGQTYYFRTAGMQGGVTTYSPTSTFVTVVPRPNPPATIIYDKRPDTPTPTPIPVKKAPVREIEVDQKEQPNPQVGSGFTREGFNNNGASVIGAGNSTLPTTLVGWIALLVAFLVIILMVRMIYDSIEDRERRREEERQNREFLIMREAEKKELE